MAAALPFRLVSEEPSQRFLGLTAAERNFRVAQRAAPSWVADPPSANDIAFLPTLRIPSGVVITPAFVAALPAPVGTSHLVWDPAQPPIVWTAGDSPGGAPTAIQRMPEASALDVSTRAARQRSIWRLLRASGKKTDGWIARHIHRKISRLFSYVMLQMGLTAIVATFLTFAVGVASAWLFSLTTHESMILGALLFWFASVADGIDGEMARLTLTESVRGDQLDTAVDQATYLVVYAGVIRGAWRQGLGPAGWLLILGVAIGVPLVAVWAARLIERAHEGREDVLMHKPIELGVTDAAVATGAPALWLASGLFTLLRRESFSMMFFVVSLLTARRIVIPTIVTGDLLVALVTLVIYRDPIERAIRARYVSATASSDGLAAMRTMAASSSISATK